MVKNPLKNSKRKTIENNTQQNIPKKQKINHNENNKGSKLIKLYCPKISKISEIIAWDDQRIDLGCISSMFGIEPATLLLNGYFISRGFDFIASSLTWNSLIHFFDKKGLSTGVHSSEALVVDGKFCKSGCKRIHEPTEADKGRNCIKRSQEGVRICGFSYHDEINSPNSKRLKENNDALGRNDQAARHCDTGLKRRHCTEDASPFKKVRAVGSFLNENILGRGVNRRSCIGISHCGHQMSENMKRLREDEFSTAVSCKKTR